MNYTTAEIWTIILCLGMGTFLIRYSFLGLLGGKDLPPWLLRHLRFAPAAILPGLVAPLVLWPEVTDGTPDFARIAAAFATVGVGLVTRSALKAMAAGAITLYGLLFMLS